MILVTVFFWWLTLKPTISAAPATKQHHTLLPSGFLTVSLLVPFGPWLVQIGKGCHWAPESYHSNDIWTALLTRFPNSLRVAVPHNLSWMLQYGNQKGTIHDALPNVRIPVFKPNIRTQFFRSWRQAALHHAARDRSKKKKLRPETMDFSMIFLKGSPKFSWFPYISLKPIHWMWPPHTLPGDANSLAKHTRNSISILDEGTNGSGKWWILRISFQLHTVMW